MLGKAILAIALISAIAGLYYSQTTVSVDYDNEFKKFISEYRLSYFSKDEYSFRKDTFNHNLKEILRLNSNPNDKARYGVN